MVYGKLFVPLQPDFDEQTKKRMIKKRYLLLLLAVAMVLPVVAQRQRTSDSEARKQFEKAYNLVFGPQGCTLHYNVNLIGVYKTEGTIWYKGTKSKFIDRRADSYNDGVTMYTVYRKKKVIEINDPTSDKRDKYSGKFKFTLDDFDYEMERTDEGLLFKLRQRREARGTVKQVRALVDPRTYAPISVKVKVALFWANITISNFKSGGISDDIFVFPRANYGSDYRYVDKR